MSVAVGGVLIGVVTLAILAGLLIYIVREAATLKTAAASLQAQLTQFKEGGFDQLVADKLAVISRKAAEELESRERVIRAGHEQLVEQQERAAQAEQAIHQSLGAVRTEISGLRDLHTKVGELNDLLKPQQLRGELGEVIVRELIADKLPKSHYEEEHTFADGKKVEFAIKLHDKVIPIDSKLQLEDFRRMCEAEDPGERQACRTKFKRVVREKIDEVRSYIRPEEGTYNFALMVVPSEAVYYDLVASRDFLEPNGLAEYSRKQHVFLVSPSTFWAYVTAIAQGLRGLEIGRRADEILGNLQTLSGDIRDFASAEFRVLGEHLRNAGHKYEEARDRLQDIEGTLRTLERVETRQLMEEKTGP